jgi:hypothetical protein
VETLIDGRFLYLALCLNVIGTSLYLYKSLTDSVRPHLVTWLLWAIAPLVAFAGQASAGAGRVALLTLLAGISPAVVFLVSVRQKDAHWKVSAFDLACGLTSLAAIVFLAIYREKGAAIGLAIASDAIASVPTYRKSIVDPSSESWVLYGCLSISALVTLATLRTWTITSAGFAAYLAVLGVSLSLLIAFGKASSTGSRQRW